eukprot:3776758-Pleurochrysis_carterae.AAC.1
MRELLVVATLLRDHVVVHLLVQRLELRVVQRLGKKLGSFQISLDVLAPCLHEAFGDGVRLIVGDELGTHRLSERHYFSTLTTKLEMSVTRQ